MIVDGAPPLNSHVGRASGYFHGGMYSIDGGNDIARHPLIGVWVAPYPNLG